MRGKPVKVLPSILRRLLVAFALAAVGIGLAGCASSDPDNYSGRPWNSPKGWEGGIPSGMTEGR